MICKIIRSILSILAHKDTLFSADMKTEGPAFESRPILILEYEELFLPVDSTERFRPVFWEARVFLFGRLEYRTLLL